MTADLGQINMGIAVRIATLMQLHREETYAMTNPTKELIIQAESARRTLVSVCILRVWIVLLTMA